MASEQSAEGRTHICGNCLSEGKPSIGVTGIGAAALLTYPFGTLALVHFQEELGGTFWLAMIAMFVAAGFLTPAATRRFCPVCGVEGVVPVETPAGRERRTRAAEAKRRYLPAEPVGVPVPREQDQVEVVER